MVNSCPKNLQQEIDECMRDVQGFNNQLGAIGMLQSDLQKTETLCRDGSIQKAFDCLSQIYNNCAKTKEGNRDLDLTMDPNKWRNAMGHICNNIDYLKDYPVCENRVKGEFSDCALASFNEFMLQHDELKEADMSEGDRRTANIDNTCLNADKVLHCLKRPIEKFCPNTMTTLLIKIVKSFTPNICANKIPTIGGSHYDTHNKDTGSGTHVDRESNLFVGISSQSDSEEEPPKGNDVPYRQEVEEADDNNSKAPKSKDEIQNRGVVGTAKKQQSKNGAPRRHAHIVMTSCLSYVAALSLKWIATRHLV